MKHKMIVGLLASSLLVLALTGAAFAERPGRLVAATNNDCAKVPFCPDPDGTGTLLELDSATGAGNRIGVISDPGVSLAFSEHSGLLYASMTVLPVPAESHLVLLDPNTGETDFIGVIRNSTNASIEYSVQAMGFSKDGQLYGIDRRSSSLLRIDPTTGLAVPVGSGLGFTVRGNGGTIDDDVFYLLSGSRNFPLDLYTVDLNTGEAVFVGPTGLQDSGIGIAAGPGGKLWAVVNNSLYEIDRSTGTATYIGDSGFYLISGLEFIDEVALQCPCDAKADGTAWENHGEYTGCVASVARAYKKIGRITGSQYGAIVSEAARSDCGK